MHTLRPYTVTDFPQIINLVLLNTPQFFCPPEQDDLERFLNTEIENYFVIEENGVVLASGGSNIKDNTGFLSWYMVHPAYHNRSLGRQLVGHNMEILKNTPGLSGIEVRTSQLVYPFYERSGFVVTYTEDNFWGEGMHLYHMKLPSY